MLEVLILFEDDGEAIATRLAWAAAERGYAVWGDPNHFRGADDEELVAATRAAKAVLLLWTPKMVRVAKSRESVFATLDRERTTAALLTAGLEPPASWADQPADLLAGAEDDTPKMVGYLEKALRRAGPPSKDSKGKAPVDRMRALEEEAAAWRAIRDLGVVEGYDTYLKRFGEHGLFSALARSRREDAAASGAAVASPSAKASSGGGRAAAWFGAGAAIAGAATAAALLSLTPAPMEPVAAPQVAAPKASAPVSASAEKALQELQEAKSELARSRATLAEREDAIVELEIALDEARGEAKAARALSETALAEDAGGAEESEAVQKAMTALDNARSENASLRRGSAELRQELTSAKEKAAQMEVDLQRAAQVMTEAMRSAETKRQQLLDQAKAEQAVLRKTLEAKAEKLQAALDQANEQVASLEGELRQVRLAAEAREIETADAQPLAEEPLTRLPASLETHNSVASAPETGPEPEAAEPQAVEAVAAVEPAVEEPEEPKPLFRAGGPAAKIPSPRPEL